MFTCKISEDGKLLALQSLDGEQYNVECACASNNQYYINHTENVIVTAMVQQIGFDAPLYAQLVHADNGVIVRFANTYNQPKKSAFNLTVYVKREVAKVSILSMSEVFDIKL